MSDRANLIYEYDGSLDGLLCCVFESVSRREIPLEIRTAEGEPTFFPIREIETRSEYAERVGAFISRELGEKGEKLISSGFFYGLPGKEMAIFRFLRLACRLGRRTLSMQGDPAVADLMRMAGAVGREAHLMLEFLRFSEYGGGLAAVIEPRHFVLPHLADHFQRRLSGERFLIYDKAYHMAFAYQPFEGRFFPAENLVLPPAGEQELFYRRLWKGYYDEIAIAERENPRCRMSHMPKRFWRHMTELQERPEDEETPCPAIRSSGRRALGTGPDSSPSWL